MKKEVLVSEDSDIGFDNKISKYFPFGPALESSSDEPKSVDTNINTTATPRGKVSEADIILQVSLLIFIILMFTPDEKNRASDFHETRLFKF